MKKGEIEEYIDKYQPHMKHYYGYHISNSDLKREIENEKISCIQMFLSSPRNGIMTEKTKEKYINDGVNIKRMLKQNNKILFIHSAYVLNFAKDNVIKDDEDWSQCSWIKSILTELEVAHYIGAQGCIIHVGKSLNNDMDECINNMYNGIKYVLNEIIKNKYSSKLILETGAGQGTEMLCNINNFLEFYRNIIKDKRYKRHFKICVDTCHIFASGYNIKRKENSIKLFQKIEEMVGLSSIALIHLNDSKKDCCSKVDRHETLGEGYIGKNGISMIIMLSYLSRVPLILETYEDKYEQDINMINNVIERVKRMIKDI